MKNLFASLLCCGLVFGSASAKDHGFSVGGEALYLRPGSEAQTYAIVATNTDQLDQIKTFTMQGSNSWGFRLFAGYECDCFFAEAAYTLFDQTETKVAHRGDFATMYVPLTNPSDQLDTVKGRLKQRLQTVDIRGGRVLCDVIYAYGNVRWAEISRKANSVGFFENGVSTFVNPSHFEGAGLGCGLGTKLPLRCGFGLEAQAGLTGLIGTHRSGDILGENNVTEPNNSQLWFGGRQTVAIPALDLLAAVTYSRECGCVDLEGRVGYRFDYYRGVLANSFTTNCYDFSLGGLFLGLTMGY